MRAESVRFTAGIVAATRCGDQGPARGGVLLSGALVVTRGSRGNRRSGGQEIRRSGGCRESLISRRRMVSCFSQREDRRLRDSTGGATAPRGLRRYARKRVAVVSFGDSFSRVPPPAACWPAEPAHRRIESYDKPPDLLTSCSFPRAPRIGRLQRAWSSGANRRGTPDLPRATPIAARASGPPPPRGARAGRSLPTRRRAAPRRPRRSSPDRCG